jgi:bifunctional non-homologous end joining protein LigD
MKRKLDAYESKRRFEVTPEPRGRAARGRGRANESEGSFVIQRHDARRLHYDFRLELDGTLKSWAVPKGPSLDPGVKRLAVHVEDHPMEYGKFEGRIPEGSYGAGEVAIWDHGVWRPEGGMRAARDGYAQGKLKFTLDGEKLHGGFTLVRSAMHDGKQ